MSVKIYFILILLFTISGCLEEQNDIKSVHFKDLVWNSPNSFNLIVDNPDNEAFDVDKQNFVFVKIAIDGKFISYGNKESTFELKKGENIYYIPFFENEFSITSKRQAVLTVTTLTTSSKESIEILRKVIDMPYISLEIQPNKLPINPTNDYIALTNNGNLGGDFFIVQRGPETITNIEIKDFTRKGISKKCGIETLKYHTYSTKLSPGSSKNIYLTIKTFGENCELKQGETGSTELEIYYLPNNVGEYYIPITDVTLNYKI